MSQPSRNRAKRKSPAGGPTPKRRSTRAEPGAEDLGELYNEANHQLQEADALLETAAKSCRGRTAARRAEPDDLEVEMEDAEEEDEEDQLPRRPPRAGRPANLTARSFDSVKSGDGRGKAGQIKSLRMENFMCHEHVSVEFKPHVNFISGQNGSGKSAVLQALQFCLGVSARHTGRGTAAKQLIRTGASHMLASVTLWNTGTGAYLPGYYGPEITVERRVSAASGVSSWMIKKADGSKASTSAKDVLSMRDFFGVDAENPAICLTQVMPDFCPGQKDTARTFSGSANAKRKYEVYMDALHFTKIIMALNEAKSRVMDMQSSLEKFLKVHQEKDAKLRDTEAALESMAEVKGWKDHLGHARNCVAWSSVHVSEAERARLQNKLSMNIPKARQACEEDKKAREDALADVASEYERQHEAFQTFSHSIAAIVEDKQHLAQAVNDAKRKLARAQQQVKTMENEITTARAMRDEAMNSLAAAEEKNTFGTQNAAELQAKRHTEMKQATQQADAAEANVSAARQGVKEAEAHKTQTGNRVKLAEQEHADAAGHVRAVTARIQDLQRFAENPVTAFGGPNVPRLLTAIERHRRSFHRPPIGPIGALLSLEEDQWATAVEAAIGKAFDQFIVHDHRDMQQLRQLAQQNGMPRITIIVSSFDLPPHDLSRARQPSAALTTIMRILQLKPDSPVRAVLSNTLLDHNKMERLALVSGRNEGMALVDREAAIKEAWGPDGWMGYKRGGSVTSVPAQGGRNPRLQKDVSHVQAQLNQEKLQVAQKERQCKQALEAVKRQDREAAQALQLAREHARGMESTRRATQMQMSQLASQHQAEPADDGDEEDLTQYQDDLRESDARLQEATRRREAIVNAVAEAHTKVEEAKEANSEKEAHIRAINAESSANERALQDVADRKQVKKAELDSVKASIMRLEESVAGLQENIDNAAADIATATELGKGVCSQEEEAASLEALQANMHLSEDPAKRKGELDKLNKGLESKIRKSEARAGRSLEDLEEDRDELKDKVESERQQLAKARRALTQLNEGHLYRARQAKKMREKVEKEVNLRFLTFLRRRRHSGAIKIDYDNHELEMEVEVDKKSHGQKSTNMKSLSGGERSFSTLAFIMAIGGQIDSCFHAMDEFDVFLDTQNRQVAIRLLLECARDHIDTQFILLSPQDVNSIRHAIDHVHEDSEKKGQELPDRNLFTKIVEMRPARAQNGQN